MGDLFSSPQQTYSPQYTIPQLPSYIQNYLNAAAPWLTSQIGNVPQFTGQLAPTTLSPQSTAALNQTSGLASGAGALAPTANTALGTIASGAETSPYIASTVAAIQGATGNQLQQQKQAIQQQFASLGLGNGTPLVNAESNLYSQVLPAEAAQIGQVETQQFNTGLGAQLGAAGQI